MAMDNVFLKEKALSGFELYQYRLKKIQKKAGTLKTAKTKLVLAEKDSDPAPIEYLKLPR